MRRTIAVFLCLLLAACTRQAPEPPMVLRSPGDPNCDANQQDILILANKQPTCKPVRCYLATPKTDATISILTSGRCPPKASP
jgi:hypothetical protein